MPGAGHWTRFIAVLLAGTLIGCSAEENVRSVRIERRDLVFEVAVTGVLEAEINVNIGPPALSQVWDFKIARMTPEGTVVEAGTPVLEFETMQLQERLRNALAERDTAIQTLEKRGTDMKVESEKEVLAQAEAAARLRQATMKVAVPAEVSAGKDLELARLDLTVAEAEVEYRLQRVESVKRRSESEMATVATQVERADAKAHDLEQKIAAMRVLAPRSGMVIYNTAPYRGKKKVGDSVWRMDTVMQIPDLATVRARGQVDEVHAGRVHVGQTVRLRLDAHPDFSFAALITSIDPSVRQRSRNNPRKVIELVLEIEEVDQERMRPGMRFQGDIELSRLENVIATPLDAVQSDEAGLFVWHSRLFGRQRIPVDLGQRNGDWVEVLSGLEAGDVILTGGGG